MKFIRLAYDPSDKMYILQVYTSKASLQVSDWFGEPLNLSKLYSTLADDNIPFDIDDWLEDYTTIWTQPFDEFVNTYPEYFI